MVTTAIVVSIALGIGSLSAVASVVDAVLIRPLPYDDPRALHVVVATLPAKGLPIHAVSYPDFIDWRAESRSFAGLAALSFPVPVILGGEVPERLSAELVSADFFSLLGIDVPRGRSFSAEEDLPGSGGRVALVSDALRRRLFGDEASAVGRHLRLGGERYSVVGVLPPGFQGLWGGVDVWLPLSAAPHLLSPDHLLDRGVRWHVGVGRLAEGVAATEAQQEMSRIAQALARREPETNEGFGVDLVPLSEWYFFDVAPSLHLLLGAAALILLAACVNVANLLLLLLAGRQRELALRKVLGARPQHLVRQVLGENLALGLLGGALGLMLAFWGTGWLAAAYPLDFAPFVDIRLAPRVAAAGLAATLLSVLLFSLPPIVSALSLHAREGLLRPGDGGRGGGSRLRAVLVAGQAAIALVLVVAAVAALGSLHRLRHTDPGYRPDGLLSGKLALQGAAYDEPARIRQFADAVLDEVGASSAIEGVALAGPKAPPESTHSLQVVVEDRRGRGVTAATESVFRHSVSPGYFATLGIPVLAGRTLQSRDDAGAPRVAVVNEALARRVWPQQGAVGRRIRRNAEDEPWITIVGVVGDAANRGLLSTSPDADLYLPLAQEPVRDLVLLVRSEQSQEAVAWLRKRLAEVDPTLPLFDVVHLDERLRADERRPRFLAVLVAYSALIAVFLALLGLFTAVASEVGRRRREIGVRLALGAERRTVLRLLLRKGLLLLLPGLVLGVLAALWAGRLLESALYDVRATQPVPLAVAVVVLLVLGIAAAWLPARRALAIDPVEVLRTQ